ncbi:hypothetical protein E2542_SST07066 [Spatholobus suberectus]|nr:hypothetical protein E2542_SST07066 [Spatholobus suberectus]
MATPVNNGHSEERYEKPLMENGEHTFLARPMYKRRKVFAIRDFPDGCGPVASRIDPVLNINIAGCGSANGRIVEDKNGEHLGGDTVKTSKCENDGRHSELKDSLLTQTLGQKTDCGLNKENHVVSSHQVDGATAEDEPAKVTLGQTTDCGLNKENPVVSSHKMDGPTAEDEAANMTLGRTTDCDLNQEGPVVSPHQVDGSIAEDEPTKVTLGQTADCGLNQENPVVSSHQLDGSIAEYEPAKVTVGQTTDCGLNKENPVVSSHQVDGPTAEDEPGKVPLVDMETLNTEFARTANTVKCDSYMLKSSSPAGEVAVSGGSKPLSSNVNISGSSACMVEPVTRRYLPQRKVSAVRDFPPLCGRNAPHLSKDVCLEGISSLNNKKVGQQNLAVDDNPMKKCSSC